MKVAISSNYIDEPFGGGNLFIKNLTVFLIDNGHTVTHSLKNNDTDYKEVEKSRLPLLFLIYRHKIQKFLKTIFENFKYHFGRLK